MARTIQISDQIKNHVERLIVMDTKYAKYTDEIAVQMSLNRETGLRWNAQEMFEAGFGCVRRTSIQIHPSRIDPFAYTKSGFRFDIQLIDDSFVLPVWPRKVRLG